MSGKGRLLLLAALGAGVFLVGVELMVTAVALPSIVADLADWTRLREASWIVNGYLVAYIAVMPLAGRAADRFNVPALFGGSLVIFAVASVAAGAAPNLETLIGARVVQGLGAGAVVPLATAGASLAFDGAARARAIGVVGALTFLGMAAGPFLGAAVLNNFDIPATNASMAGLVTPSWRWIFYLAVPVALLAVIYTWAAAGSWPAHEARSSLDVVGALLFTTWVAAGLLMLTTVTELASNTPLLAGAVAAGAVVAWILWTLRTKEPFIDLRLFRDRTFSGAVLLSLLTGYALATAIIGGAVFVDRVRYGLADEQQLVLGSLALSVALGAVGSGFLIRRLGVVLPSLVGLVASIAGLWWLSSANATTPIELFVYGLALFGFGFGLTVTARSAAALEAVGRRAFGLASGVVTVARMLGMAIGLATLTVLGSNRIEALSVVLVDQAARDTVLPPHLRGRPLENSLVVDALETWAANEAATILSMLFLVAAAVTAVAIVPTLAMRNRPAARGDAGARTEEMATDDLGEASRAGIAI
ncbi:MAG TPA: MFS transporter [Candidatus Limnocylindrales bacterium]|nr:MFS transporter [Candidatus Limnocylindrales bacterium]